MLGDKPALWHIGLVTLSGSVFAIAFMGRVYIVLAWMLRTWRAGGETAIKKTWGNIPRSRSARYELLLASCIAGSSLMLWFNLSRAPLYVALPLFLVTLAAITAAMNTRPERVLAVDQIQVRIFGRRLNLVAPIGLKCQLIRWSDPASLPARVDAFLKVLLITAALTLFLSATALAIVFEAYLHATYAQS